MQYIYIAKAMEEIATNGAGAVLVDHIASSLSKKNKTQVAAINQVLNFNFPVFRTRPANANRIVNLRRAAVLISKTFDTTPPLLPRGRSAPYESWDDAQLEGYIHEQKRNAESKPTPTGAPGTYLAASFWAYSTEDERLTAVAGYQEALELCTFGLLAATQATRASLNGPSQVGVDIYVDLVRIWFGSMPGTVERVKDKLHKTLSGLKTNYVGLGYAGKNVRPASEATIKELCFGTKGGAADHVQVVGDGIFAYAPSKGSGIKNKFVLAKLFFDSKDTTINLTNQIVAIDDEEKMDVTRSGAVLHEATHIYADTIDADLNNDVYRKFGWVPPPTSSSGRKKGYGAQRCLALATIDPASAINNADSYRVFCELAKYHRQHAGAPIVVR